MCYTCNMFLLGPMSDSRNKENKWYTSANMPTIFRKCHQFALHLHCSTEDFTLPLERPLINNRGNRRFDQNDKTSAKKRCGCFLKRWKMMEKFIHLAKILNEIKGMKYCDYGYYVPLLIYALHIFVVFFKKENAFCLWL